MGDVINLRQARKAQARDEKTALAAANRAKHGLSKADKQRNRSETARAERALDGMKREPD